MYNIALIGNPNTGKSTLYNAITGGKAKIANWHGVTVKAEARLKEIKGEKYLFTDLPGIYSLKPYSMEENAVPEFLSSGKCDLVLSVVETKNFYRSIGLTLELIERGYKAALVLTMFDEFEKKGGRVDIEKLSSSLGIPVFTVNGTSKKSVKKLVDKIPDAVKSERNESGKKAEISKDCFFMPENKGLGILDRIILNKYIFPLFLFIFMLCVFYAAFGKNCIGDYSVRLLDSSVCRLQNSLNKVMTRSPLWLKSLIIDGIVGGLGKVMTFMPQLVILYMCLFFAEESGIMSRLAFMTDGFFMKAGLNGRAAFSVTMGLGCTAVGVMTTKGLNDKDIQKRSVLSLPFISCSAKIPVYMVLLNAVVANGKVAVLLFIYSAGFALSYLTAYLLNKKDKNKREENFIMELPPYRFPTFKMTASAFWNCIKNFLLKIGGSIFLVMLVLWFINGFSFSLEFVGGGRKSIMFALGSILKYIFYPIGINSPEISVSVIAGLFAKETVAASLGIFFPSGIEGIMSFSSGISLVMFIAFYTPCLTALAAMRKEIGLKSTLKSAVFQFFFALLISYLTYFICAVIILLNKISPAIIIAVIFAISAVIAALTGIRVRKIYGKKRIGKR